MFVMGSHSDQRGFTLIEIIVVLVILGFLGVATFRFVFLGVEFFVSSREHKQLSDEGRLALERMVRELRTASQISSPSAGSTGSSVNFTKISYDYATGAPTDSSTDITFQQNGSSLERTGNSAATVVLASNVSSFQATYESSGITLALTLTSANGGTVSMRTKVSGRNM